MRLSYTDLKKAHFRNIGKANKFSDPVLLQDFQYSLGTRYQLIFDNLASYINQDSLTASTVASTQYYYYPVGTVSVDSATVQIGSIQYTLTPIYDQFTWNQLNAMQIQPTAIPQFIFPRKSDFGIWPIPQDVYTINFQRFYRDRNLMVEDFTDGTVAVTNNDATITVTGGTLTPAMVGRWFTITDTSVPGQGYWYRIGSFTSTSSVELETGWASSNATGAAYRICETPELPEGAHALLPYGTAADFYSGLQNDVENSKRFDNAFWTGSMSNISRDIEDKNVTGGLIGMIRSFKDRDKESIVYRQPAIISPSYKIFAQSIS